MNKNKLLLTLTVFFFCSTISGQWKCPVKKIYAYKQVSVPGVKPANNGTERKETYNYWFYLTVPVSKSINISHIWISGKKFSVKSELVALSPVTKTNLTAGPGNETIELVPATRHTVILIYPSGLLNEVEDISKRLLKKIEKNELVVSFTWKNKNRLAKKRMITVLKPEPLL